MSKTVTFGEVMIRLATPGNLRFSQARSLDVSFGGGEANVAVSLANYGIPVSFVTRLPRNDFGAACVKNLRSFGVDTSAILFDGDRMGIYFLETGAAQRGSSVIYDRAGSSLATIEPGMIDWETVFCDAERFHWTGITPAISEGAARVCREAVCAAKKAGCAISCDLNYRKKLWKWGGKPDAIMTELVSQCDTAIGNEEDAEKVFGITAHNADVTKGQVGAESYHMVCRKLRERFSNLSTIAITLRGSLSASHNTWSGVMMHGETFYSAPTYDIEPIVDRVGGGDSFSAGLIYGLVSYSNPQDALDFAVTASCLKHSVYGDFNDVSIEEVEKLMRGDASGRVSR